jgi:hypothetical protein
MTPEATPITLATTMSTTLQRKREGPALPRGDEEIVDDEALLVVACTFVPLSKM